MKIQKNKRGWIKIVEAFTSILLIAGALIIIINSIGLHIPDSSLQVYDTEYAILKEIQLSSSLREEILAVTIPPPIIWANFGANLNEVKNKIEFRAPGYLTCEAQLCEIDDDCVSNTIPTDRDIYVQSAFFGAKQDSYNPRKLNLFCWVQG